MHIMSNTAERIGGEEGGGRGRRGGRVGSGGGGREEEEGQWTLGRGRTDGRMGW